MERTAILPLPLGQALIVAASRRDPMAALQKCIEEFRPGDMPVRPRLAAWSSRQNRNLIVLSGPGFSILSGSVYPPR